MLRLFAPLLIALSLLIAPIAVLAGMPAEMMACSSETTHHAGGTGECEMSAEHCAVVCAGLQAALPRVDAVGPIGRVSTPWPPEPARHEAGRDPALPEQPPRFYLL